MGIAIRSNTNKQSRCINGHWRSVSSSWGRHTRTRERSVMTITICSNKEQVVRSVQVKSKKIISRPIQEKIRFLGVRDFPRTMCAQAKLAVSRLWSLAWTHDPSEEEIARLILPR